MVSASLTEWLTNELRERVLRGQLSPGTVVVEPQLAEEFKVSKTPVREALRQLTSEGLLQILPKKGYLVRGLSISDLYETLDVRMLLEPFAASRAANTADAGFLGRLREHLDEQGRLASHDPISSMRCAQQFHQLVAKAGNNSRITTTLEKCFDDTARAHYVLPGMQHYMSLSLEMEEHEAIYAALEAADPAGAHKAMQQHLKSIRAAMTGQFQSAQGLWD